MKKTNFEFMFGESDGGAKLRSSPMMQNLDFFLRCSNLLFNSVRIILQNLRTSSTFGEARGDMGIHYSLLYHVLR